MSLDWSRWPNFREHEFACKGHNCCNGRADMDAGFMDLLQALRWATQKSITITSGYRCPEHNASVSTTGRTGPHTTGRAVDIGISGIAAIDLIVLARILGFKGFGPKQHGPHARRFVHLDTLSERFWTYQ